jgi:tripartite-type tricarboxylate transporter receptor subunit TctC
MASEPTWIPQKLINPLIQSGVEKEPELPDVPLITEQAVKPGDKPLLEFMARAATVGRPLGTTPGVPAERVAALRAAFAATIKDPDFVAEAEKERLEIRPMTGEKLADIIAGLLNTPDDVRERMKIALEPKAEHTLGEAPARP